MSQVIDLYYNSEPNYVKHCMVMKCYINRIYISDTQLWTPICHLDRWFLTWGIRPTGGKFDFKGAI